MGNIKSTKKINKEAQKEDKEQKEEEKKDINILYILLYNPLKEENFTTRKFRPNFFRYKKI